MTLTPAGLNAADGRPIALVGGMLLDGYEAAPIHHSVVLIQGNRIVEAGSSDDVKVPGNAHVIDIRGKTVLPGLIDLHAHLELIGHGDYREYYDFIGDLSRLETSREIAARQLLRSGVTSVVDLGSTFGMLETRDKINNGDIPGPRIVASGPWISRLPVNIVPMEMQLVVSSTREARARTIELIERGVDVIKAWERLTADDYLAIVEEAHKRGVKVHAHLYDPDKVRLAIDAGVDVLQHMGSAKNPLYDDDLVMEIAHKGIPVVQTIAHRIWIYPDTVAFPERLRDPVLESDLPADWYAEFQRSFQNFHRNDYFRNVERAIRQARLAARQFIKADAVMGVGTDGGSPMNFHSESMWREMSALVDSGMTPIQVISAATKANAEILGNMQLLGGSRQVGTIEPGMIADVMVVEGNPLFDINMLGQVALVIRDGIPWFTPSRETALLREIGKPF
jgi:imidazolonepropionase-like amidohydrolase